MENDFYAGIKHPDRGQVEDAVEKAMKEAEL